MPYRYSCLEARQELSCCSFCGTDANGACGDGGVSGPGVSCAVWMLAKLSHVVKEQGVMKLYLLQGFLAHNDDESSGCSTERALLAISLAGCTLPPRCKTACKAI